MIELVKLFITKNNLPDNSHRLIIGLSGGSDSVVLLDILLKLGYDCVAAHCNFHLRGAESDRDASFVARLCATYNIPLESTDFETEEYAAKQHISIEMAARELRYNWFERIRQKQKADYIAIAHHRDDSIETVLLNLIRGTGIRGLTGIKPIVGRIIRPLLSIDRARINNYIIENQLSFVEDSTNSEDNYTRNKIRLQVLPLLETINPSVKEAIERTANNLLQVESVYNHYIENAKKSILNNNQINISHLLELNEPEAILYEILSSYNFNSQTINQLYTSLLSTQESGKLFKSSTHEVLKDRDNLIIRELMSHPNNVECFIAKETSSLSYPLSLKIELLENKPDLNITKDKNILYADCDEIKFPIQLRHWQKGDWFIPLGMHGKKKISDYFSDNKFTLFDKEAAWIISSDKNIIWIVGHRTDERYKITPQTKTILKITVEN